MSPAWCAPLPALPCAALNGLKCGPALLASAALQSPFSWIWNACALLACSPPISPVRCKPLPIGASVTLPLTRLPEADASTATACLAVLVVGTTALWDDGDEDEDGVVLHAARVRADAAASRAMRMGKLLLQGVARYRNHRSLHVQ